MAFKYSGGLKIYSFELLQSSELTHGIFTRKGGVSTGAFHSLNLGGTVGDSRENVVENRRRLFNSVGRRVETIFDVWQVHGVDVICTHNPRPLESDHQKADAILTDDPKVTLFMRFADCVPILLHDPKENVIGIAHAGWMGTVHDIAGHVIRAMQENYGCKPENILAGVGPSICPDHYEIGENVLEQVYSSFNEPDHSSVIKMSNGKMYLDLWEANRIKLAKLGVEKIQISRECTACNNTEWYSHRAENGNTGRFGALIALNEKG
jgi:polyphenol oxidase